jgi:hypothetical protein
MAQEPYPLTNAYWKTERAKLHLDALRLAVADFCEDSHSIVIDEESERDQVRYRIHLKQPHVFIYLICGDYLQCLRTALDQAVWSLINQQTGADSEASEFPVFEKPLNAKSRGRFNAKTDGLSGAAIDYIESLQPYNLAPGIQLSASPLWCLHELNRIDKHRRISVRGHISLASREHFGLVLPEMDFMDVREERTDYGYDVVCRGEYKHLKPKVSSHVIFGEPQTGIFMDIDEIGQLYNFVADEVLVRLASFAPKRT